MQKEIYLPPVSAEIPFSPEQSLCTISGGNLLLTDPSLTDFDVLDDSDIVWDVM